MREALALLIPACAIGIFMVPRPLRWERSLISAVALALCLGIGFSSLTSIALIINGIAPTTGSFVLVDVAIWASVWALGWWVRRRTRNLEPTVQSREQSKRVDWILRAAFATTAMLALASVIASYRASPHGDWDAWAIWNQHARFLFRGGETDAWRALLTIEWSQPDYPLLLPASVARVWAYAGHESTLGPMLIAMMFAMASVALVMTALHGQRAWIAGALILAASTFLTQVSSQCADIPLAGFMVATLAVAFGDVLRIPNPASAFVAGATSAMAAWTKNEGLVFALLMLLVAVALAVRRPTDAGHHMRRATAGHSVRGQLLWAIAGGAPVVIAIMWFKLAFAPPLGLVEGLTPDVLASRLVDLNRHATVIGLMAQHVMRWSAPLAAGIFPLVALAAVLIAVRDGQTVRVMAGVSGLMLASYYLVYVTTPFDISWHVSTSIDRLLVQLWPALVLTVFLGLPPSASRLLVGPQLQSPGFNPPYHGP